MAGRRPSALPRAQARPARGRWLREPTLFIGVFLAVQMLLPLTYYTVRDNSYDERWAWRMFSPERMTRCRPRFLLGDDRTEVTLDNTFHEAWREIAARGRIGVAERMALELCRKHPDESVRVELVCREIGKSEPIELTEGWDVCLMGRLR